MQARIANFLAGGHGEAALVEFGGVLLIGCEDFVGDAHNLANPFSLVGLRLPEHSDYKGPREGMQPQ
jgi:hypothetical protein